MSSSIDQRIVSMKFDNAQFESGAKTSLGTLERLKNSLNFEKSSKALDIFGDKINKFSVSPIESGIESLELKFSAFGVAAATVISNVTTALTNKLGGAISNVTKTIFSKGFNRAMNLEQANFSMMGILEDSEKVAKVMGPNGPVQMAVDGTAYGLDAAALAASNLIATGMDIDELEKPLKTISGMAAQTGKSYEMMSDILVDAYAKNYASGMEISRLQEQGINAVAELQKYYKSIGKDYSADDIFNMSRKKQISAEDLTNALVHFYDNAARANDTYSGALSNLNAALGRLGAKFEVKKLENMRNIFNALRPTINALSAAIDPFINFLTDINTQVSNFAIDKINNIRTALEKLKEPLSTLKFTSFEDFVKSVEPLLDDKKAEAFRKFFGNFFPSKEQKYDEYGNQIEDTRSKVEKMNEALETTPYLKVQAGINSLIDGLKSFGSGLSEIPGIIGKILSGGIPYLPDLTEVFRQIGYTVRDAGKSFESFFKNFNHTALFSGMKTFADVLNLLIPSVIKLGSTIGSLLAPQFKYIVAIIESVSKPILTLIRNIVDITRKFDLINLAIEKMASILTGVFKPISDWFFSLFVNGNQKPAVLTFLWDLVDLLSGGFEFLAKKTSEFLKKEQDFTSIGNTIVSVFKKISSWLSPVGKGFDNLKESIKNAFSGIGKGGDGISIFEKIGNVLEKAGDKISKAVSVIGSAFSKIKQAISETLDLENSSFFKALPSLLTNAGSFYFFFNFLKKVKGEFSGIRGTIDSVIGAVSRWATILTGKDLNVDTDGVKSFAVAVGILSASLLVLSFIDDKKLKAASLAMVGVMADIIGTMWAMGKITNDPKQVKNIRNMTIAISILSGSMFSFAYAFNMLGKMDWNEVKNGLVGMAGLMSSIIAYLAVTSKISKHNGKLLKAGGTLIALAIAIDLLVIAVKKLGEMNFGTMAQGLAGVAGLLLSLGLFSRFSNVGSFGVSSGLGILALSAAILVLSSAVEQLGTMKPETVASGLLAIGFALLIIGGFVRLVKSANPISAASGLLITAAALLVISGSLKMLSDIDPQSLAESLVAMALAMGVVVSAINLLPKISGIGSAATIVIAAAGILVLSVALKALSTVPLKGMLKGLAGVAGALLIFGVAAVALKGSELTLLALGTALTIFSSGILILAAAFRLLGSLSIEQLGISLLAVAGSLAILGAAAYILGPLVPVMSSLSFVMALFGSGLFAVAVAIQLLTPILALFASSVVQAAVIILDSVNELVELITNAVTGFITALLTAIQNTAPLIFETIDILFGELLLLIENNIPKILDTVGVLLEAFLNFIVEYIPMIVDAGIQLILGLLEGIRDNIGEITTVALEIITNFINGIAEGLPGIIDSGFNLLLSFIHGIADAVNTHSYEVGEAAWDLVEALINGVIDAIAGFFNDPIEEIRKLGDSIIDKLGEFLNFDKAWEAAKNLIDGIIGGIKDFFDDPLGTIADLGSSLLDSFCDVLGINSPSKEFEDAGGDVVDGLDEGLSNYNDPIGTIGEMGKSLLSSLSSILNSDESKPIGEDVVDGVSKGINSKSTSLYSTGDTVSSTLTRNMSTGLASSKYSNIGSNAVSGIVSGINSQKANAVTAGTTLSTALKTNISTNLPQEYFTNIGSGVVSGIQNGVSSKTTSANTTARNTAIGVKNSFSNNLTYNTFYNIGVNTMAGMEGGILAKARSVNNNVVRTANNIVSSMKNTLQIKSPSRIFYSIGEYCMYGLRNAFTETSVVTDKIKTLGDMMSRTLNAKLDEIDNGDFTITPILDLSEIQNGTSRIDSLLNKDNRLLGSISSNIDTNSANNFINDALSRLTDKLNQKMDSEMTSDDIYDAIRNGLANATVVLRVGGKEITSIVNSVNYDDMESRLNFLGTN